MEELMEMLESIEDKRQQSKVRYTIKEVVLIVFCCTLSNVDDWEDMGKSLYRIAKRISSI